MFIRLSFMTLIFALGAVGTHLVQCDATGVLPSIWKTDEWTKTFHNAVSKLSVMGSSTVTDIETAAIHMNACLTAATASTVTSEAFTHGQTEDILDFIKQHLEPDTEMALSELVSQKPTVTLIGMSSLAELRLETLQNNIIDFANAFTPKVPESMRNESQATLSDIENKVADAIHAY